MKRVFLIAAAMVLVAGSAYAQSGTFGGRISSYSTDIDAAFFSLETGREMSIGLHGSYRNGMFVLNGQWDHDFEGGISVSDFLPFDAANYERDRIELAVGISPAEYIDLVGGFRLDEILIDSVSVVGFNFGDAIDNQAILVGINFHSPERTTSAVNWYALARAYFGTAEFDFNNLRVEEDSFGYRIEVGVPIAIGDTQWSITPGFEWESIETDEFDLQLDTNRFFLGFTYAIR